MNSCIQSCSRCWILVTWAVYTHDIILTAADSDEELSSVQSLQRPFLCCCIRHRETATSITALLKSRMDAEAASLFNQGHAQRTEDVSALNRPTNHYNYASDQLSHSDIIIPIFSVSFDGNRAASRVRGDGASARVPWQPYHIFCACLMCTSVKG